MKRSDLLESLRNWLPGVPRLNTTPALAPLQFASSGGGGGGYDDPDDDFFDDEIEEEPAPRRRRGAERRPTAARQRTVQTDPDDRYWTDYLRIALPVIGLLLVIAVFWYWAQQLIDDNGGDLTPTEQPGLAEVVDTTTPATEPPATPPVQTDPQGQTAPQDSTPENPLQANPTPTPPAAEGETTDPAAQDPGTDNQVEEQPVEEQPAADPGAGAIAPEMTVVVTEEGDGLNLRSAPTSAEDNIVTTLAAGTQLTVVEGPVEAENFVWWEVVDPATGNQGFVAQDFIQPAQ